MRILFAVACTFLASTLEAVKLDVHQEDLEPGLPGDLTQVEAEGFNFGKLAGKAMQMANDSGLLSGGGGDGDGEGGGGGAVSPPRTGLAPINVIDNSRSDSGQGYGSQGCCCNSCCGSCA